MEVNLRTPSEVGDDSKEGETVGDDSKEGETLKPKRPFLGFKKMAMKFPAFGNPLVIDAFQKRGLINIFDKFFKEKVGITVCVKTLMGETLPFSKGTFSKGSS